MEKADFTALAWLALIALVATGALLRVRQHERYTFLNTLWLFFLGIAGQAAAVTLLALELPRASSMVHTVFRILTAVALIRLFGFVVFRLILPLAGKRPTRIVEDLAIVVAYVGYGLAQLRGAGVDLGSLVTTSAILTAAIAFSMQDTLGNVLGGLAIQLDNSVQVGDWIKIDELTGRVRDIRWRTTLIETRNWETVLIPNSALMKGRVSILGRRDGSSPAWRRILNFMVDPGVPPARVIAIVEDEMRELAIPHVGRMPAPSCVLYSFEQGNLRYQLRYFLTDFQEDDTTDSMVRVHLFSSLQRAGIRMAEPQHTVHAVQRDEAHAQSVKQRELTRRLQVLNSVQLFSGLSENEKAEIAERLQYAPFARGDAITKQGNAAHWLYILAFGDAEVLYEPPGGAVPQLIGSVQAGQFFGEMALINGEARNATVMAKTDVECYRLDRASFQELLRQRPEIAAEVRRVIGARKPDLEQARDAFARVPETVEEKKVRLLTRIRRFFFGQAPQT
ncbi:MAG: cyclic nucleotide-binding domain-containing protein [Burkholderiales bacterium]